MPELRPEIDLKLACMEKSIATNGLRNVFGHPILSIWYVSLLACHDLKGKSVFPCGNRGGFSITQFLLRGGELWQLQIGKSVGNTTKHAVVISFAHACPDKCKLSQPRDPAHSQWRSRSKVANTNPFCSMDWVSPFSG
jgi:hypothetical protein